jgi:GTP cyclohydrolase FolE2
MNAPDQFLLPDIQSRADTRSVAIDRVGVKGLRYPLRLRAAGGKLQSTVATVDMGVVLPPAVKGTHMSRFVEVLEAQAEPVDPATFSLMVRRMLRRLDAAAGAIEMRFPYFVAKRAPVSRVESLLDYDVVFRGELAAGAYTFTLRVQAPVTSLCPCSKEISAYGAHNQRSHITIEAQVVEDAAGVLPPLTIEALVGVAEAEASCEVFGLLKRPDEKWVTERAYDNPKFVEDLARDIALRLDADPRIAAYRLEAENFESIHNHSAYATIARDKRTS